MGEPQASISLTVLGDGEQYPVRKFVLTHKSTMPIGRSSSTRSNKDRPSPNPSNGFFDTPVVSRLHAEISFQKHNKSVLIEDMQSMHGTIVNGKKLIGRSPCTLRSGDIVTIGSSIVAGEVSYLGRSFCVDYRIESPQTNQSSSEGQQRQMAEDPVSEASSRRAPAQLTVPAEPTVFVVPDSSSEASIGDSCDSDLGDYNDSDEEEVEFLQERSNENKASKVQSTNREIDPEIESTSAVQGEPKQLDQEPSGGIYVIDDESEDEHNQLEPALWNTEYRVADIYEKEDEDKVRIEAEPKQDGKVAVTSKDPILENFGKNGIQVELNSVLPSSNDMNNRNDTENEAQDHEVLGICETNATFSLSAQHENLNHQIWNATETLEDDEDKDATTAKHSKARENVTGLLGQIETSTTTSFQNETNRVPALQDYPSNRDSYQMEQMMTTFPSYPRPPPRQDPTKQDNSSESTGYPAPLANDNDARHSDTACFEVRSSHNSELQSSPGVPPSRAWQFSDRVPSMQLPVVAQSNPLYHSYFPVHGISQDPYLQREFRAKTRESFPSSRWWPHMSHKVHHTGTSLNPSSINVASSAHVASKAAPTQSKDVSSSLYKVSIPNIVDPEPSSNVTGYKRKFAETNPTEQEENEMAKAGQAAPETLLNPPVLATEANLSEPQLKSTSIASDSTMLSPNQAPEVCTGKNVISSASQTFFPDPTVDIVAEPPKKRARTSASSFGPFMLGALMGGIGVIGALISLPDSLF